MKSRQIIDHKIHEIKLIDIKNHEIIPTLEQLIEQDSEHKKYDIESLVIKNCKMNEKENNALLHLLASCEHLKKFILNRAAIDVHHAARIFEILPCETLSTIELSDNWIDVKESDNFFQFLKNYKHLKKLDLSLSWLQDIGMQSLAKNLDENNLFSYLNLSCNDFHLLGLQALMNSIQKKNIYVLDISYNRIDNNGAEIIANTIRGNQHFKTVNIKSNHIGDSGAEKIASAIEENANLESLDLSDNAISIKGILSIFHSITAHPNLKQIVLKHNHIDATTASELNKKIPHNSQVEIII